MVGFAIPLCRPRFPYILCRKIPVNQQLIIELLRRKLDNSLAVMQCKVSHNSFQAILLRIINTGENKLVGIFANNLKIGTWQPNIQSEKKTMKSKCGSIWRVTFHIAVLVFRYSRPSSSPSTTALARILYSLIQQKEDESKNKRRRSLTRRIR